MQRRRVCLASALVLVSTAALYSSSRGDDDEAPPFAAYTMAPPPGWKAAPVPSPHIFRCVADPGCAKQVVVITSRRTKPIISSDAQLRILATLLAQQDVSSDRPANSTATIAPMRTGSARGYPAFLASSRGEGGSYHERVTMFPGRAMVTVTSSAPDVDAARRNLDAFVAGLVLLPQP